MAAIRSRNRDVTTSAMSSAVRVCAGSAVSAGSSTSLPATPAPRLRSPGAAAPPRRARPSGGPGLISSMCLPRADRAGQQRTARPAPVPARRPRADRAHRWSWRRRCPERGHIPHGDGPGEIPRGRASPAVTGFIPGRENDRPRYQCRRVGRPGPGRPALRPTCSVVTSSSASVHHRRAPAMPSVACMASTPRISRCA